MKGRKPKPAAVLKLEKGKLYDQQARRSETEPKPIREILPRCPRKFSTDQRKHWRYFSQILKDYGLFNAANAPILEMLTVDWVMYKSCEKSIAELGGPVLFVDPETGKILKPTPAPELDLGFEPQPPSGIPKLNPYFKPAIKLEERIMKCLGELGLSSMGLARIGSMIAKRAKAKTPMEGLLD